MAELEFKISEMDELKKLFDPKTVDKAFAQAVQRTTAKAATMLSREARKVYAVSAGDIRSKLSIHRANRDHQRTILYTGSKLLLSHFKPKTRMTRVKINRGGKTHQGLRQRVTVRVRKDKGRQVAAGAWLAKGQVWRRADKDDNQSRPTLQFGPSIPQMISNPEVIKAAEEMVRVDLPEQFNTRMDWMLEKSLGK